MKLIATVAALAVVSAKIKLDCSPAKCDQKACEAWDGWCEWADDKCENAPTAAPSPTPAPPPTVPITCKDFNTSEDTCKAACVYGCSYDADDADKCKGNFKPWSPISSAPAVSASVAFAAAAVAALVM